MAPTKQPIEITEQVDPQHGAGTYGAAGVPDYDHVDGLDGGDVGNSASAYYAGMFQKIGAYSAAAVLAKRFLAGLDVEGSDLQAKLCEYVKQQPLWIDQEARRRVTLAIAEDAALERQLLFLSDAIAARDLAPDAVPRLAARLAVLEALADLARRLDQLGGGGVGLVATEALQQLTRALAILDDPHLRARYGVAEVFGVIARLLDDESDHPTAWEARRLARMASSGRKLMLEIAERVDGLDDCSDADIDSIAVLAYRWRAAHDCRVDDVADVDADDDSRLQVIRMRHRVL